MDIKVSVIIPVYNMEKYLSECLDSIIRQTLREIEIIAVDDGSIDGSLLVLEKYANKYSNIIILRQRNQGAGPARNNGIRHAKGKYLIFIDPDDFYPNQNCLKVLYNAAEENCVAMCGGIILLNNGIIRNIWNEEMSRIFYCNKIIKTYEYSDIYGHQRYLFLADLIKDNDIYFPPYRRYQDPPFTVKALVCAGEFYGVDKEVYEYRICHKKEKFPLNTCIDIIYGIRDVFRLAKANNLRKVYDNRLRSIFDEYIVPFCKYSFCGNKEIDETIKEINEIIQEWIGGGEGIILTEEKVKEIRQECFDEQKAVLEILNSDNIKIIYGAGSTSYNLIERYQDKMRNVVGIAVSQYRNNSPNQMLGFPIKQIEQYLPYRSEAQVMIATVPAHWNEIEKILNNLGFYHVKKLDVKKLELAEALLEK